MRVIIIDTPFVESNKKDEYFYILPTAPLYFLTGLVYCMV